MNPELQTKEDTRPEIRRPKARTPKEARASNFRLRANRWLVVAVALGVVTGPGLSRSLNAQLPFVSNLALDSNELVLTWNAQVGGYYDIQTVGSLQEPWVSLTTSPLLSLLNQAILRAPLGPTNQFYQVVQKDKTAPLTWGLSPSDRGIVVTRRGTISVPLYDDGVIDTNTIAISITNGPPIKLNDPRLSWVDGVLTYTPGPNEVLGDFGQTITVAVSASDLSGNRLEDLAWSFQLEPAPIPAANVVAVSNAAPGLVLLSTNAAGTWIFGFTGDASGLAPGVIVVGTDPLFPYRRLVVSITSEDPGTHVVEVVTTEAGLEASLQQGSVQFEDSFGAADFRAASARAAGGAGLAPAGAGVCCALNFDGRTIAAIPGVAVDVTRGRIDVRPHIGLRGSFGPGGLQGVDLDLREKVSLDLMFHVTAGAAGSFTNRIPLGSWRKPLPVDFVGPVPAWAEARLEMALGFEGTWQGPGTFRVGVLSTNLLAIEARFRSGGWTNASSRIFRYDVPSPDWQTNLTAEVRAYVDVVLTLDLDGVPGPQLRIQPGLEAFGKAFAPPGHAGFDLFLYDWLAGVLTLDARGWDPAAPTPSIIPLPNPAEPIFHVSRSVPVTPALRPIADMVWIPPGRFAMGRAQAPVPPDICDCPLTQVTWTEGFFVGRFEVTQREFVEVMGTNASIHHGGIWATNLDRPVENVTWQAAANYCALLTERERQAGRIPFNYAYRLPFEAEWEYACRAGTAGPYHYGERLLAGMANFDCRLSLRDPCATNPVLTVVAPSTSTNPQPVSVGRFAPNAWGLHDMHGNVHEWCLDWLGTNLPGGSVTDPRGDTNAPVRAYRGGSYLDADASCQSSSRASLDPGLSRSNLGLRMVLATSPQAPELVHLTIVPGFNFIANQLDRGSNTLGEVLQGVPVESSLVKWNPATQNYDPALSFDGEKWVDAIGEPATSTLAPGEGAFLFNPESNPYPLTFGGFRRLVITPPVLISGLQVVSRQVPEPGNYQNITGRAPVAGAKVLRFESNNFSSNYFNGTIWIPSTPTARIGEPWFLELP